MKTLLRAVISGFGFSLGAALFRKIAKEIGLDDSQPKSEPPPAPAPADDGEDGEVARA
jgi:hypothetical protein